MAEKKIYSGSTELVYRKELRPVLRTGATVIGELLAAGQ
jgi:hypothetical protein